MKKTKTILIIPAYNEEENILNTYNTIVDYNKKHKTNYEVVVINDGSKDNTENILIENNINHVKLIRNLGIGGAVQTGYKYAYENGYDYAIQFDGDGQHDVNYVKDLLEPLMNGEADMTIGSRFIDKSSSEFQSSGLRRFGINIISNCIKYKTKFKVYDTTSGFRAVNRKVMESFCLSYPVEYPEPISIVQMLAQKNVIKEVPVSMNERTGGVSSIRKWKSAYYMFNVVLSILCVGKKVK